MSEISYATTAPVTTTTLIGEDTNPSCCHDIRDVSLRKNAIPSVPGTDQEQQERKQEQQHNSSHGVVDDDNEKALRASLIRSALPDCQPQEGSPANTFTDSELCQLQAALLPEMMTKMNLHSRRPSAAMMDICKDPWEAPKPKPADVSAIFENCIPNNQDISTASIVGALDDSLATPSAAPIGHFVEEQEEVDAMNTVELEEVADGACPQEAPQDAASSKPTSSSSLDWYGAPRFPKSAHMPREFREMVRRGEFTGPTNAVCPGFLQCNMVVVPKSHAFDFLLFCQRNPKACPLIEVCDEGSAEPLAVAPGADLRTDVPKYAIYRDGKLEKEVTDVTEYWPKDSVAFLIGCSFSYDGALMDAGIPLRSAEAGKNVPMYNTSLPCRAAGAFSGNLVVSMKPIPAMKLSKHVEITSKYAHAHGGPVAVGSSEIIGIRNIHEPEWGEPIDIRYDEVPVFHACGVTPQAVLMESKIPFAITHAAGHMFVTDLPSDMGV